MKKNHQLAYNYLKNIYRDYGLVSKPSHYSEDHKIYLLKNGDDVVFIYDWVSGNISIKYSDYKLMKGIFNFSEYGDLFEVYSKFINDYVNDPAIFNPNTRFGFKFLRD